MESTNTTLNCSIVIPLFNEAQDILSLISKLEQILETEDEVIFVDTGSTDETVLLIENKIKNLTNYQLIMAGRAYPGKARNIGVSHSNKPWVAFLDAGLTPDLNWLKELKKKALELQSDHCWGSGKFFAKDSFARVICALSYGHNRQINNIVPASLFKVELINKVNGFPEHLRAGEDVLFRRNILLQTSGVISNEDAFITYSGFPTSWEKAIKKWFVYAYHCALGNVFPKQAIGYVAFLGLEFFLATNYLWILMLLHFTLRGLIDPLRKASFRRWWESPLELLLIAPIMGFLLDNAKAIGYVLGYLTRPFKTLKA